MGRSDIHDCTECGWQGRSHEADGGFCPLCGAEAPPWNEVYHPDGTPREPESSPQIQGRADG